MKKLYKIWRVIHDVNKPVPKYCSYVVEENGNWAYPLVASSSTRTDRDDLVSLDLEKLQEMALYLNQMADNDEHYEVREDTNPPEGIQ